MTTVRADLSSAGTVFRDESFDSASIISADDDEPLSKIITPSYKQALQQFGAPTGLPLTREDSAEFRAPGPWPRSAAAVPALSPAAAACTYTSSLAEAKWRTEALGAAFLRETADVAGEADARRSAGDEPPPTTPPPPSTSSSFASPGAGPTSPAAAQQTERRGPPTPHSRERSPLRLTFEPIALGGPGGDRSVEEPRRVHRHTMASRDIKDRPWRALHRQVSDKGPTSRYPAVPAVQTRKSLLQNSVLMRRSRSDGSLEKLRKSTVVNVDVLRHPYRLAKYDSRAEQAALAIQRMWRLHRLRDHFFRMKNNLQEVRRSAVQLNGGYELGGPPCRSFADLTDPKGAFWADPHVPGGSRFGRAPPPTPVVPTAGTFKFSADSAPPDVIEEEEPESALSKSAVFGVAGDLLARTARLRDEPPSAAATLRRKSFADGLNPVESVESLAELSRAGSGRSVRDPNSAQEEILRNCVAEFNINPTKGLQQLIACKLVENDRKAVANLLFTEPRLDKTSLGEYLGIGDPFNIAVLGEFVGLLDFTGQDFDTALRKLLTKFRLPGEAQKIDRIMNNFAIQFCKNNPGVFNSLDTGYILAYSLIMLNTDQHSPHVKAKMRLQDFIRNNRGINDGHDLPEEMLRRLYFSIVSNEIKMKEDDNVARINMVCSHIIGKFELWENSERRHIGEFFAQQVPDLGRPNQHKHERMLFLFSDAIIITKPRPNRRYQFRHLFNLIQMTASGVRSEIHCNAVELRNIHGILVTFSFAMAEEREVFLKNINEVIREVASRRQAQEEERRRRTAERAQVAKSRLESHYNAGRGVNRYRKIAGNLRAARAAMKQSSPEYVARQRRQHQQHQPQAAGSPGSIAPVFASLPPRPLTPSASECEVGSDTDNDATSTGGGGALKQPQTRQHRRRNTVAGASSTSTGSLSQVKETLRRATRDVFITQ